MALQHMQSEEARTQWRTILDLVSQEETDIVVERHGKPTAVVMGYASYEAIQAMLTERRTASPQRQGQQMAAIMEELAQLPALIEMADPVTWQRELRQERSLPDRTD